MVPQKVQFNKHIFDEPNLGKVLVRFANDKQNKVNFLVVYCDLMNEYAKGKALIGSVADYAVRYALCPVILPKQPVI